VYSKLKIIDPLNYPDWDCLLLTNKNYSFFHSSLWAQILKDTYNYSPHYFTIVEDNKLMFLVPAMEVKSIFFGNRMVSLPFSDYCEPIIDEINISENIFKFLVDYGKRAHWKSFEFRGGEKIFKDSLKYSYSFAHKLDLTQDLNSIFKNFKLNSRRNIKKAQRENVKVEIFHDFNAIKIFYDLQCITRKRHGIPPQPFSFYTNIFKHIVSNNAGHIILASLDNKVIAGSLFFHIGKKALFKFGASDMNFRKFRANNLIMWEAISWYSQNGYTSFNFGRTDSDDNGLRRFKLSWGSDEVILNYYKFDLKDERFIQRKSNNYFFIKKVFKKTPEPLLRLIGSMLYRHIG
jgi:lipid II:glycine glycyltransferase (peptidoglycan interpeptide bridge formation enzyme)